VFVVIGGLLIAAALWGWVRSQSDVDLQASAPTMLSLPNGASVSTDSRTLRNDVAVNAMLRIFEANQRAPLPQADGLFSNGVVVPDSADAARARTEQINNQVHDQATNFGVLFGASQDGPAVLQRPPHETAFNDGSSAVLNTNSAI
jgi:hypothetical protein